MTQSTTEREETDKQLQRKKGDFSVTINNCREMERVSLCLFQFANLWLTREK